MPHHPLERSACKPKSGMQFYAGGHGYTLRGKIGNGAAGLVRRAERHGSDTVFAVKFLAPDPKYIEVEHFEDVSNRFKREGERGANLEHPNIVKVLAYSENIPGEGFDAESIANPFIIMEYAGKSPLESYIRKQPAEDRGKFRITRDKLHVAIQIASALKYLKGHKIIHRDVKPANIFLSREDSSHVRPTIKLGDFGVVKWGEFHAAISTGTLTMSSQKGLGTLKYMSPEQAMKPKDVTIRSDVYSLGITLFELFTSEILLSQHHVFQLNYARMQRGSTNSRYLGIDFPIQSEDEHIASLLLDSQLRGVGGRPTIDKFLSNMEWEYEQRYGIEWNKDF